MAVLDRTSFRAGGNGLRVLVGLAGLAVAVAVRVDVAGVAGSHSARAGLLFALLLVCLAALTARPEAALAEVSVRRAGLLAAAGILGALVLCVPATWRHVAFGAGAVSGAGFSSWAAVVVIVAVAEESLLRGSLYRVLDIRYGAAVAIGATSVAFALLHVPVYGWDVLPLDLAVGVWLGALRAVTGSVAVPAVAHALADLAGWWLR
jgi:membrane protease YdiL (CAAX protease family)